jgi:hypothetical protein
MTSKPDATLIQNWTFNGVKPLGSKRLLRATLSLS